MYSSLLNGKLESGGFATPIRQLGGQLVDATIDLHRNVMQGFLPSAVKFHYQFNLRELSNITQVVFGSMRSLDLTAPLFPRQLSAFLVKTRNPNCKVSMHTSQAKCVTELMTQCAGSVSDGQ